MGMSISVKQNTSPLPAAGVSGRTLEVLLGFGEGTNSIPFESHHAQEKLHLLIKEVTKSRAKPAEIKVRQLSIAISKELGRVLRSAGISVPIELSVDEGTAEIFVKGERRDKEKILKLIRRSGDLENKIRNIAAIGSHVLHIAEHLKFQREYLASKTPEDVVARYSYLFGPQRLDNLSLRFDGNDIRIVSDGKACICDPDENARSSGGRGI